MSKSVLTKIIAAAILCFFVAYSICCVQHLIVEGFRYLRWYTVLWLYISVALAFGAISYCLFRSGTLKSELAKRCYLIIFGIFLSAYIVEAFLRVTGNGITYTEKREGIFVNPAERVHKNWYMVGSPHLTYELRASEFSFARTANSLGFADREWSVEKDSNEVRVIALGDSFTEGDGAAFESSYPKVLERLMQKDFPMAKITVMNAGICGSDPWFEYKKFSDLLLKYQPDIVVYTNGSNDLLYDHLCYGGMERFLPDSTIRSKIPNHKWIPIYEVSYIFRLLVGCVGYDDTFFSKKDRDLNRLTSLTDAIHLSNAFSQLAAENNFICVQLIRPEKQDIEDGHYDFNLQDLLVQSDSLTGFSTFNILQFYNDSLNINESNAQEYFWHYDGHHNAKGYEAMAQAVYSCIKSNVAEIVNKHR